MARRRDDAAEVLRSRFPRLSLADSADSFVLRHAGVVEERWSLQSLSVTGSASTVGSTEESFAVGRVRSGSVELSYGSQPVDTSRPYLRPAGRSDLRLQDASLELVTFDHRALRRDSRAHLASLRRVLAAPTATRTGPLSPAAGRHWDSVRNHVSHILGDPELSASPLIRDSAYDLLLRTFLASFPVTTELASLPDRVTTPPSAAIRRAIDHLDAHAAESITVAGLAEAVHLSVRAVQTGIRRHTGRTVTQYLRDRRLEGVRQELLASDPASTAIAEVARRWGFAHLGRFAAEYRRLFGELPSDTLRR